jgi:rhodanese-related sulfurtransferase
VEKFDKDKTYLVYCATGSRSVGAVSVLQALGFKKVYNLKGGIDEWKDAGKPVVR